MGRKRSPGQHVRYRPESGQTSIKRIRETGLTEATTEERARYRASRVPSDAAGCPLLGTRDIRREHRDCTASTDFQN